MLSQAAQSILKCDQDNNHHIPIFFISISLNQEFHNFNHSLLRIDDEEFLFQHLFFSDNMITANPYPCKEIFRVQLYTVIPLSLFFFLFIYLFFF